MAIAIADQPKILNKMVNGLAEGNSHQAVADKLGIARETVTRYANREEIRAKIEEAAARMIEQLPRVQRINDSVLKAGEREAEKLEAGKDADKQVIEMAVKVGDKIGQAVGIQASHAGSTVINNILVDNSQTLVLPSVQGLLDNVIDITPSDSDAS